MNIVLGCTVLLVGVHFITTGATDEKSNLKKVIKDELLSKLLKNQGDEGSDLIEPDHKIIGGWSATSGDINYQVYINAFILDRSSQECGGSLISRNHVLTASHCLIGTVGSLVILGASNKYQLFGSGVQSFLVPSSNYLRHPDYNDATLKNDIAIIRLPESVEITFTVSPILLPTICMNETDYFSGKQAIISGFGKEADANNYGSDILKMSHVNITSFKSCQKRWRRAYDLDKTQICTDFNGSSTCSGDSGGPLAVDIDGKRYLVGITSFGTSNCERKVPSVYTNVVSYISWINNVISKF